MQSGCAGCEKYIPNNNVIQDISVDIGVHYYNTAYWSYLKDSIRIMH